MLSRLAARGMLVAMWLAAACSGQVLDAGSNTASLDAGSNAASLDAGSNTAPLDAGSNTAPLDAGPLDAGPTAAPGLLPIDDRDAVILLNDSCGSWQAVYAVLFASMGGPALAGIVVNASNYAPNLGQNMNMWHKLVAAARDSGLPDIPDPVASTSSRLVRPDDGDVDSTIPNGSEGARLILELSALRSQPDRPLVVVAGGRLTDVADAYLLDPTVTERVVVVAALGSLAGSGGVMGAPNGELDPWADWIVARRFRYVQVSSYYDPTADIPAERLPDLPANALGDLIVEMHPYIGNSETEQVGIIAVGLPGFVTSVQRVALSPADVFDATTGPSLVPDESGHIWLVTGIDSAAASTRLWQMLQDPTTFAP